ncbi:MAG: hypothetical protein LBP70_02060 [Mycoplasmataceae bacterium]|jgi:aspartyl/glutamyl-tRNA(Asn/Gln) amidotransferase C subunit|nr:hypothetical protein [Mycoplasmataceae bacterium]
MKIDKKELENLAISLHFKLDNNQLNCLYKESEDLLNDLEHLDTLQVGNLQPMHYPINHSMNTLREDIAVKVNSPEDYLKNAKHSIGKYVITK